jgi:hypothetical protein
MKINPGKSKAIRFTSTGKKSTKLFPWKSKYSGSEQLQILGNNTTKRFKLGGTSKLHSAESLEGTSFRNACSQKGK